MNEKMNKKPVIIANGHIKKLNKILLNSDTFKESWLQEILYAEPSILPTNEIDSIYSNLIPIGREIPVSSGFIDNFYISSKGYLVIVETKLWRNPESRREVVGQILDYAKDIQQWDYEILNDIYYKNNNKNLFDMFIEKGYYSKEDEADFIDIVTKNIVNARFLLMIVGDGIREGVEKMVSFLNNNPTMQYNFALCELAVYELENGEVNKKEYFYLCKYISGEFGTGDGPEFNEDPKYADRGKYIPEIVKREQIEQINLLPGQIRKKFVEDVKKGRF